MFVDNGRKISLSLTDYERKKISVLIVESEASSRSILRQALQHMGIPIVSDSQDHALALQKIKQRSFSHVIFEAKKTNMPSRDFLLSVLEYDDRIIAIPSSFEPTVDDVFGLLVVGARGYLVKPFTDASVEDAFIMATKGEPLSESILYAKDRNQALASLVMTALDRLATVTRQAEQFETAQRELPRARSSLGRAVAIAKTFCKGGDSYLFEALLEFCLERSSGPASRLGRVRKRCEAKRTERDSSQL